MSAEPLSAGQRRQFEHYALSGKTPSIQHLGEWFEGYRAAEERAEDWMRRAAIAVEQAEKAEDLADVFRLALVEILSPPDESKGRGYGCLDLHEARHIAESALAADDAARGES